MANFRNEKSFERISEKRKKMASEVVAEEKMEVEDSSSVVPEFPALSAKQINAGAVEMRSVKCPPHRYTPLRDQWQNIMAPLVKYMKLQVRFNPKTRTVDMKTSELTTDAGALQKGCDFVEAFMMGFEVQDSVALLRMDDLYIRMFEIKDVKDLKGDHLNRAIGRIAGAGGKTKYAIENATKTRIVLAHTKIHILGTFSNIKIAQDAICSLILGAPPGKVYNRMRQVASRSKQRF